MKKPKTVIEAEAALAAKRVEVEEAEATVKRLQSEVGSFYRAVTAAQTEADASLPQCRMVSVAWRSGKEEGGALYVIVRRTPAGKLVVRRVGDASGHESRFEWLEGLGRFRDTARRLYASAHNELRDVPAEYMPKTEAES